MHILFSHSFVDWHLGCFHILAIINSKMLPHTYQNVLCLVAQLCPILSDPLDCSPPGSSVHRDFPGKNIGVSCHTCLQGIFLTQGWNPGLLCCRQILYPLSYPGSPWLSSKSLQVANVGEDMEKGKPSYTVGKNMNWCSHYGKQYGDSSKNWK